MMTNYDRLAELLKERLAVSQDFKRFLPSTDSMDRDTWYILDGAWIMASSYRHDFSVVVVADPGQVITSKVYDRLTWSVPYEQITRYSNNKELATAFTRKANDYEQHQRYLKQEDRCAKLISLYKGWLK